MECNAIKKNPTKEQDLNNDRLMPGHMVSADQYISQAPGRIYHTKVKSDPYKMFSGWCAFIDHTSGYVRIKHQVAIPLLVKCVGTYRSLVNSQMREKNNTYKHGIIIIPTYWNDDSPMIFINDINAIQIQIKYNSIQNKN